MGSLRGTVQKWRVVSLSNSNCRSVPFFHVLFPPVFLILIFFSFLLFPFTTP